jgi:hypothetical protein
MGEGVERGTQQIILIRSTPSQIDFIEQQKLGRVKEAAPILLTKARMECFFEKASVANRNKHTD